MTKKRKEGEIATDIKRKRPRKYSIEVRNRAKYLYLIGAGVSHISRDLQSFSDSKITAATIWNWAKEENWDAERTTVTEVALKTISQDVSDILKTNTVEYLRQYHAISAKGMDTLGDAPVHKATEAASLIDMAIRGERELMENVLSLKFIVDVLTAVRDELYREDLSLESEVQDLIIGRIGTRLKLIAESIGEERK